MSAVEELLSNPARRLRPVGFIDDAPERVGKLLCGLPIVGTIDALERTIHRLSIRSVVVSSAKIPTTRLEKAMDVCLEAGARLLKMEMKLDGAFGGAAPPVAKARPLLAHFASTPADQVRREGTERVPQASRASPCPACRSVDLHRSRSRSLYERIRRRLTAHRLFRCDSCGWRGWLPILDYGVRDANMVPRRAVPDFVAIDAVVRRGAPPPHPVLARGYSRS